MKHHISSASLIIVALVLFCLVPAHASAKRVALVIGNGAYSDAPLKNPVNDAREMAAILEKLGFEVFLEMNADRRNMVNAVISFGERLHSAKAGLFYFAGHGVQSQGRNFLIPVGARIASEMDFEFEALDANRVLRQMEHARAQVNIVIMDACRNNPYRSIYRSPAEDGLAGMTAPRGTLISYATSPHNVAVDGEGDHSPYTQSLLRNMTIPGLTIEDVFKRVRGDVLEKTQGRQVTWESSSLVGNFYLASSDQPTTAVPGMTQDLSSHVARLESELAELGKRLEQGKQRELEEEKHRLEALLLKMDKQRTQQEDIKPEPQQTQPRQVRYTKLGQNGVELPDTTTQVQGWLMTRDNETGLIWEIKTEENKNDRYSYTDAQQQFIFKLNRQKFGGFDDWRLPTADDLMTLVKNDNNPTIDTQWFPNTIPSRYWTSSIRGGPHQLQHVLEINFNNGRIQQIRAFPHIRHCVRAVRSGTWD